MGRSDAMAYDPSVAGCRAISPRAEGASCESPLAGEDRVDVDAARAVDRLVVGPALAGTVHDAPCHLAGTIAFHLVVGVVHDGRAVDLQAPLVRGDVGGTEAHLELAALDA